MIGFARALIDDNEINDLLVQVQHHCYGLMAELAATPDAQAKFRQVGSDQQDDVRQARVAGISVECTPATVPWQFLYNLRGAIHDAIHTGHRTR